METSLPAQMYQDFKDMLPSLQQALETGVNYGGDLAHRFIVYDIWMQLLDLMWVVPAVSLVAFAPKVWRWAVEVDDEDFWIILFFIYFLLLVISVIVAFAAMESTAQTIIKDLYIPEVRVIEVVHDLVSTDPIE